MKFERRLQIKIIFGYIAMLIIEIGMVFILIHERERIRGIEAETEDIRHTSVLLYYILRLVSIPNL